MDCNGTSRVRSIARLACAAVAATVLCAGVGCEESSSPSGSGGGSANDGSSLDPGRALTGSMQAGRNIANAADLATIAQAVRAFELREGRLPSTDEGLMALVSAGDLPGRSVPVDSFGNPIRYEKLSDHSFRLTSLGADGEPGGSGRAQDVVRDESL